MAKILLVEDDKVCAELIEDFLAVENHTVDVVGRGDEALGWIEGCVYDLMILDWDVPNISGVELCQRFRQTGGSTPILMLTGKRELKDKEIGLDSGADDYLTKPFQAVELRARIRALLRRPPAYRHDVLKRGAIELDLRSQRVSKNGVEVPLIPRERALLEFLMKHPDEPFTAEVLLERVWSTDTEASPEAIRKCIERLRKKIDEPGEESLIQTIRKVGYLLKGK